MPAPRQRTAADPGASLASRKEHEMKNPRQIPDDRKLARALTARDLVHITGGEGTPIPAMTGRPLPPDGNPLPASRGGHDGTPLPA